MNAQHTPDIETRLAQRDALVTWLRMIGEECVLAGYPGGEWDVILANVRDMRFKCQAVDRLATALQQIHASETMAGRESWTLADVSQEHYRICRKALKGGA